MHKTADDRLRHLFCFFVEGVFNVVPVGGRYGDRLFIIRTLHDDFVFADAGDAPDFAVVKAFFAIGVVFYKHDLRARFQFQHFVGGIRMFRELAGDFSLESVEFALDAG